MTLLYLHPLRAVSWLCISFLPHVHESCSLFPSKLYLHLSAQKAFPLGSWSWVKQTPLHNLWIQLIQGYWLLLPTALQSSAILQGPACHLGWPEKKLAAGR